MSTERHRLTLEDLGWVPGLPDPTPSDPMPWNREIHERALRPWKKQGLITGWEAAWDRAEGAYRFTIANRHGVRRHYSLDELNIYLEGLADGADERP